MLICHLTIEYQTTKNTIISEFSKCSCVYTLNHHSHRLANEIYSLIPLVVSQGKITAEEADFIVGLTRCHVNTHDDLANIKMALLDPKRFPAFQRNLPSLRALLSKYPEENPRDPDPPLKLWKPVETKTHQPPQVEPKRVDFVVVPPNAVNPTPMNAQRSATTSSMDVDMVGNAIANAFALANANMGLNTNAGTTLQREPVDSRVELIRQKMAEKRAARKEKAQKYMKKICPECMELTIAKGYKVCSPCQRNAMRRITAEPSKRLRAAKRGLEKKEDAKIKRAVLNKQARKIEEEANEYEKQLAASDSEFELSEDEAGI